MRKKEKRRTGSGGNIKESEFNSVSECGGRGREMRGEGRG